MLPTETLLPAAPLGEDVARALERDGFLVFACQDPLALRVAELWWAAEAFFAMPDERKRLNTLPGHDGYHTIGEEYSDRPR
jgi:isopenicillin N synthase-like dioxygenase